jgi:hypothetical protein
MNPKIVALPGILLMLAGCGDYAFWRPARDAQVQVEPGGFADDVAFLEAHTEVVILKDRSAQGQVAVLPGLQGRVMTSTAMGPNGFSFGWINRELIASGRIVEHMNAFGGEDRFWLGPEGGQYSIFFEKGSPFDLKHWHTPAPIDTEPWELIARSGRSAMLRKIMQVKNYSGTVFNLRVDREIRVLDRGAALKLLGVTAGPGVSLVAFESNNRMVNLDNEPWTKETGLLSIWILGMFTPSPETTVVIPFLQGPESELGPVVNDAYFGKVPEDRLVIRDGVLFFRGDGQHRSKIGLSPRRATNVAGSYDAANRILTVVQYNQPQGVLDYVNSMWEIQEKPYEGDVINSYNDGPPAPDAKPLGPFYELETSSPAAALLPGRSILHIHRTFHFMGEEAQLDPIARAILRVPILEIKSALP